ncbi:hypothetical protein JYY36_000975 [Salmonella enterica subsp. diarizonae serovar 50:z:-]|nr:hypothetical protein [Salmonella enterica]EDC7491807.1 hypothetical protein [Salmonella enterica]EHC2385980.1 hypothetical protein [Salmonella enterica]EHC9773930.1 hypothetical protein [Salmonella enterica subsp. diarizonae serovar 50:z:-]
MNINLINCALLGAGKEGADTTKADVTFDSSAVDTTDTNLLATTFSTGVTDVGIRLLTSEDNSLKLGISSKVPLQISSAEQTLTFQGDMEKIKSEISQTEAANTTYVVEYK